MQWVRCSCGVCGPIKRSRVEAVVAWNERPEQQNGKLVEALKEARDFIAVVECEDGLTTANLCDQIDEALREAGAIQ